MSYFKLSPNSALAPVMLTLLFFITACGVETNDEISDGFTLSLHEVAGQEAEERSVASTLESFASINLSEYEIFIPELITVSEEGKIVVFDYNQMKFNLIETVDNFSGSTNSVLPIREGRGPGEVSNPVEVLITPDNELLTVDPRNGKLMYFTLDGELIREQTTPAFPHRMAKADERIVFASVLGDRLFSTLLPETGETAEMFGELPSAAHLFKEGDLSARGNKVAFMPYSSPWFALFTEDGDLLYQVSTIKTAKSTDEPGSSENSRFINSSVQLLDDVVVILHSGDNVRNIANMIDVYSVTDGKYLGSFTLDAPASLISIQDNKLYTRSRNSEGDFLINVYDFQHQNLFSQL